MKNIATDSDFYSACTEAEIKNRKQNPLHTMSLNTIGKRQVLIEELAKEGFYIVKVDEKFKEEILQAVKSGQGTDWGFNGEDEFQYDTFDPEWATDWVISKITGIIPEMED